jgi:hypothetical protein
LYEPFSEPRFVKLAQNLINRYDFQIFDGIIIAAALEANCSILYSEDMQNGQIIENTLKIGGTLGSDNMQLIFYINTTQRNKEVFMVSPSENKILDHNSTEFNAAFNSRRGIGRSNKKALKDFGWTT